MAASDDDFINDGSDEEDVDIRPSGRGSDRKTRSKGARQQKESEWEVSRTWDLVEEGADGTLTGAVEGLLEAGKRKRSDIFCARRRSIQILIDLSGYSKTPLLCREASFVT